MTAESEPATLLRMDALDRQAAKLLTRRYSLALLVVALLALLSQVAIQHALARQEPDAQVINLSGRQRMLSQRLAMSTLAAVHGPATAAAAARRDEAAAALLAAHARLTTGDEPGMGRANSPALAAQFAELDPVLERLIAAARAGDAAATLTHAEAFLQRMDRIVASYGEESRARVEWLAHLELALFAVVLVVLVLEALFVFRPAVRRIRLAIAERDRLRAQELDLEVARVAARTAAGIARDLHDSLGQQLAGLSLQAAVVERRADGDALRADAQRLVADARTAVRQCRALARRLAPMELAVGGLPAALRQLASDTADVFAVTCTATVDDGMTLGDADAEAAAYAFAQEALSLAFRAALADRMSIHLHRDGRLNRLIVRCNGRGMAEDVAGSPLLRMLRHHATRLGAVCVVHSPPGQGSELLATWSQTAA